jgi:hypothetical protein
VGISVGKTVGSDVFTVVGALDGAGVGRFDSTCKVGANSVGEVDARGLLVGTELGDSGHGPGSNSQYSHSHTQVHIDNSLGSQSN